MLLMCITAGPAAARPKIYKSAPTRVSFSATKAPDGTITAEATFTSPNPRCLSSKRFLKKRKDGNYWVAIGTPLYGGPFTDKAGVSHAFGADGFVPMYLMMDLSKGFLAPISPAGRSPFVWRAVWPGSVETSVTNFYNESLPRHYPVTIAGASGVQFGAQARASEGQGIDSYFKVAYNQGPNHVILKCGLLKKSEASAEIGL